ncbi:MAG TPA: endonuclease/exonuclease/phosphatase family protein [Dermatophilaceae bacterium]|nr:endonuclease/exonuclease/phosphatase family protein [Dermatophilaceae bacterium]
MSWVVRVASYNLRDLKDDVDAAVRVIRALRPDVLCLQEVPRHPFSGHRVSDIAARSGLFWSGGHRGAGGTTILTSMRLDLRDCAHHRLAVPFLQRQRGYAAAQLALPGHRWFTAVSVHLPLTPALREAHAGEVLAGLLDGPLVLAGDLNEQADGAAWRAIAGLLRPVTPDRPTFPARAPRRRLDVVFATPHFTVVGGEQVSLAEADLVAASDHRPVWADLELD